MSQPPKPAILAVDDDPQVLRAVRRDLRSAYGANYRILGGTSAEEGLAILDSLSGNGQEIALFLVDQRMPGMMGTDFLVQAVSLFPEAKRVLLTAYADTDAAIAAINQVRLDYYLTKPWDPPEQRLYPVLNDLLSAWQATRRPRYQGIQVIGHRAAPRTHDLRDFLTRNEQPFQFLDIETSPEAARIGEQHYQGQLPLVRFPDGSVLSDPASTEIAERLGLATAAARPHYDVVIVGAGPSGLAAGVYAASEGLATLMIDADVPGGQAGTSSLIENYLGFPSGLSGSDLARRGVTQARRFGAELLYPAAAVALRRADPARIITLGDGTEVSAEVILLATGVSYNRLPVPGAAEFENAGLYYGAAVTESASCMEQEVFVVGGANSAGQAALHFAKYASRVTMVIRGDSLAAGMSHYLVHEIERTPLIHVRLRTRILELAGDGRLERVVLCDDSSGTVTTVPARYVFTFIGARPRTEWLGDQVDRDAGGFVLTGPDLEGPESSWDLPRSPYLLETSIPGVFAAGDVRAQSVKRVAAGVGEGAMAVTLMHRYLGGS